MKRMTNRQFEAALVEAGHLYTQSECGCIALVMYDIPEIVHDARDDIYQQALKGRTVKRVPRGMLPPFECDTHSAKRRAVSA